jgi:hypothetical protein
MQDSSAAREGGFSGLEASLEVTLSGLGKREVADFLIAGMSAQELVRVVATTPPFSSTLAGLIQQHLLTLAG